MGMLIPTLKLRSEPVGKITERFFLDLGIFDSSASLTSNDVASALFADLNCKPSTTLFDEKFKPKRKTKLLKKSLCSVLRYEIILHRYERLKKKSILGSILWGKNFKVYSIMLYLI